MTQAITFLQDMIRIKSVNPPGNEEPVARLIERLLQEHRISVEVIPFDGTRANLVAQIQGAGTKPSLIFSGHMDTVPPGDTPWTFDPYQAVVHGGKIYGRGASDMKSGLAAMVMTMIDIAESGRELQGDLILAATAGEEVDCIGAKKFVEAGLVDGAGGMVIAEPSNGKVFIAHKGALWIEVTCFGKTAHGSMPEQGVNAIEHMNEFINLLKAKFTFEYQPHLLLGEPTLNLGVISGGVKTNVVPDQCRLQLDIRTVPGQNHQEILDDLQKIAQELEKGGAAHVQLRVLNDMPSVSTPAEHELVKLACATAQDLFQEPHPPLGVRYFTDASVFVPGSGGSLPVIVYGSGDEKLAHQPDEYVEIHKYLQSITFYKEFAFRYLT